MVPLATGLGRIKEVAAIDMECATLFAVGFATGVPMGALMLISDLPLNHDGIKTKQSARKIFKQYTDLHIDTGISVLTRLQNARQIGYDFRL